MTYNCYLISYVHWDEDHGKGDKCTTVALAKSAREALDLLVRGDERIEIEIVQSVGAVAVGIPELLEEDMRAKR